MKREEEKEKNEENRTSESTADELIGKLRQGRISLLFPPVVCIT